MSFKNTSYTKSEIEIIKKAAKVKSISVAQESFLAIVNKIYLFDGISNRDQIVRMTNNVSFKKYAKGEVVFNEGQKSKDIYFVLAGEVAVVLPQLKNKVVAKIIGGNMFGEMAFITDEPRSATVVVNKEPTTIIKFGIDTDKHNDMFSYPFSMLYKNIALDLTRKIQANNR
ncbi:MAG: cyclic nucleotide-binding domain-containing protein [Campylobacterota bacterium]|nr:cyclic nucleotide-binding domain-containing protein [Campylobacterota bacterium]